MKYEITEGQLETYKEIYCINCKGDYKKMCHNEEGLNTDVVEDCIYYNFPIQKDFLKEMV